MNNKNYEATIPGLHNSSITRVRPFFKILFSEDKTGITWLPKLLKALPSKSIYAEKLVQYNSNLHPNCTTIINYKDCILGNIQLESCFEFSLPPTKAFLKWLIENPQKLTWPAKGKKEYSEDTQLNRENLMSKHGIESQVDTIGQALKLLETSVLRKESKPWWVFEGFTEIDCYLETEDFCLAIEGKRTEPIASATSWFPQRNQIVRNLEVLKQKAGTKEYALILMAEDGIDPITDTVFEQSLPHYDPAQILELKSHYLGCISWSDACKATGISFAQLPDNKLDAIRLNLV